MVIELQRENESLHGLKRLFNRACKEEFGYEPKMIHDMLKRCEMYDKRMQNSAQRQGQRVGHSLLLQSEALGYQLSKYSLVHRVFFKRLQSYEKAH